MARTLKQLEARKIGLEVELEKCSAEIEKLTGEVAGQVEKPPKKTAVGAKGKTDLAAAHRDENR